MKRTTAFAVLLVYWCNLVALPESHALDSNQLPPIPTAEQTGTLGNYLKSLSDQTGEQEKWEKIITGLFVLQTENTAQFVAREAELKRQLGPGSARKVREILRAEADRGIFMVALPGLGESVITVIKGSNQPVFRLLHEGSKISFVIMSDALDLNDKEVKKYLARQHIDSGSRRTDGERGRDVLFVMVDNEKKTESLYSPKPNPFGATWTQYWREYWRATYTKANAGDFFLNGLGFSFLQMAITFGAGEARSALEPGYTSSWGPAMLAFCFSAFMGTFRSTIQNWLKRGALNEPIPLVANAGMAAKIKNAAQSYGLRFTLKNWGISLAFAIPCVAMTQGLGSLDPLAAAGLYTWGRIFLNTFANNVGKTGWLQRPIIREEMRLNTRDKTEFKLGEKVLFTIPVKQKNFENNLWYLVPFMFKMVDLVFMKTMLFDVVPVGTALLALSVYWGTYSTMRYAEKVGYPRAKELRAYWESITLQSFIRRTATKIRSWREKSADLPMVPHVRSGCASLFG